MTFLTYPHAHTVGHNFMWSVANLARLRSPESLHIHPERCYPGDDLAAGRNRMTRAFLKSGHEWMFMVDTDVGFAPSTLADLLAANKPVIGARYNILVESGAGRSGAPAMWEAVPAVWDWVDDRLDGLWNGQGVIQRVGAVGAGCLLVHRSAIDELEDESESWWSIAKCECGCGANMGEDISFMRRLYHAKIPVHVDWNANTTHMKWQWI